MKKHKYIIIYLLVVVMTAGCGGSSENKGDAVVATEQLIRISQEQVDSEGIEFGDPSMHDFEESVLCNGYIMAPTNGIALVSAPISGIVESINCVLGDFVRKGETLCMLSSNELMSIQQDFTETSAILNRLKGDYDRSKTLFDEKIGAEKDFRAIESEYKAMKAKYDALKIRLETLKLNISKIENGELYSRFPVVAPLQGYITSLNLVLGQFTEQQVSLLEIVDVNLLQLDLSVFEGDIPRLKIGQTVMFNSLGEPALSNSAKLSSIGKSIDETSKTVHCIADIKNEDAAGFINRSYIEASVIINMVSAMALPNEAILKSDIENYVFVVEKSDNEFYYLKRATVVVGKVSKDYSEIITGNFDGKVLVKGVYNLQTE